MTAAFLFLLIPAAAQTSVPTELPKITITDKAVFQGTRRTQEVENSDRLRPAEMNSKKSSSFAELIDGERGLDTQTACAFCGAKRISINGLKGEHTTILVDGLALQPAASSFYSVEAIPLALLDSIDLYRGAGAAGIIPESIGGAVDLTTKTILRTTAEAQATIGTNGDTRLSLFGARRFEDGGGLLAAAEVSQNQPMDLDDNQVAESPRQKSAGVSFKWIHELENGGDLSVRFGYSNLKTVGGSLEDFDSLRVTTQTTTPDDFESRDVRRRYLGPASKITDWVQLGRTELAAIYRTQPSEDSALKLGIGASQQEQRSVFSHGYDYDNLDQLITGLAEYEFVASNSHTWTLGFDFKNETVDSESKTLYRLRNPPLRQDDLSYQTAGVFLRDRWNLSAQTEVSAVLRADWFAIDWRDMNHKIQQKALLPRIALKHMHNEVWTTRAGAGIGARAPLTFFESQHGNHHDGYDIQIQKIELAPSLTYSLNGQWLDDFFDASLHLTRLDGMVYGEDRVLTSQSTIFRNSRDSYLISVADFGYGRRLTHDWTLEGIIEFFEYPRGYKEKLPTAAVERRISITSNLALGAWTLSQKLSIIGERDLSAYGYDKHYNIAPWTYPFYSSFGTPAESQKRQRAPAYALVDLDFKHDWKSGLSASFAVLNLFDFSQTGVGDSPTTWHQHGNHYHLDNLHVWGPLQGRRVFFTLGATL